MRREAQPSGIKTFGSTFKNPDDLRAGGRTAGQLLEAAGCRGWPSAARGFSPKHANFVENTGTATTADVLAVMAEGRRRVHERFGVELEPEVQVLGEVEWPEGWELDGRLRRASTRQAAAGAGRRARAVTAKRPTATGRPRASTAAGRSRPKTRARARAPAKARAKRPAGDARRQARTKPSQARSRAPEPRPRPRPRRRPAPAGRHPSSAPVAGATGSRSRSSPSGRSAPGTFLAARLLAGRRQQRRRGRGRRRRARADRRRADPGRRADDHPARPTPSGSSARRPGSRPSTR